MTDYEKQMIRANTSMSAFTFFLDDMTKLEVLKKLKELGIEQKKGSLSATIRVLLSKFAKGDFDSLDLVKVIETEYLFTTKKNKRSSL